LGIVHYHLGVTLHEDLPQLFILSNLNIAVVTILFLECRDIFAWSYDNGGEFFVSQPLDKLCIRSWVIFHLAFFGTNSDSWGGKVFANTEHAL
jgi:hypothetical protein